MVPLNPIYNVDASSVNSSK